MRSSKKESKNAIMPSLVSNSISETLEKEIESNPELSLEPDPMNKYSMSDAQKEFIKNYCNFRSMSIAADLAGISLDEAKQYYVAYSTKQEIRRINRAMYQRQFSAKILTIDDISRWLSALMVDESIPEADRLKTADKLRVAQMLIDLEEKKNDAIANPADIIDADIESEIKELSVNSIKALIAQKSSKKKDDEKEELISRMKDNQALSPEEEAFLKTLPAKEILKLLDQTEKKGGDSND